MRLSELWFDLLENLFQRPFRSFRVNVGNSYIKLYPGDIIRLEADGSYCHLYTTKSNFVLSKNLKNLEDSIHGWGFVRVNRSNLINVVHIKKLDLDHALIVMSDGHQITIPRRSKEDVISRLEKHLKK
ncbi:MAG: LytTR family DNA-binding domain-containing protein [Vicingaceae bacterium]